MSKPLQGKRILVTRPAAQAAALAGKVTALGGEPIVFPLLDIGPADDLRAFQQAVEQIGEYAISVFISPNAVDFGLTAILARGPWPARLQAAAIGQSTAALLMSLGIKRVVAPSARFDSEALLELPEFQSRKVACRRVLILRGNGGRELLAETLSERGARVDAVTCYKRSAPIDGLPVAALLRENALDALTVSSSEGLRNLLAILDAGGRERLRITPVFVPHQRIAEVAAELGLRRVILTGPADAGIIDGLCEYNWHHHE
jgi:uroporphyrinogen-III synthase